MSKAYKFSDFVLDKHFIAFYHHNIPIQLSSRAFEILLYLVERRGEVVEKDELLEKVWKDSFVEEANLAVHISALRRILQEKKGETRFIKTISGRGYSFISEVEEINSSQILRNSSPKKEKREDENISLAVLPFTFENSAEDNEYLANGVTQSLINDLSQLQNLRVLAYSAVKPYKNSTLELQEIGFLLDANKILTGSISEVKGKLEIVAELINVSDKSCLWGTSQVFEADDIFKVKQEISTIIAGKLKLQLKLSGKTSPIEEINAEAQKLYYRGKFILESRTTKKEPKDVLYQALKFFKEAIKKEPNYALAYTGIGSVYVSLHNYNLLDPEIADFEAKKALKMALDSDNNLSAVYVLKGAIEVTFERHFLEAENSFNRAIELNPNNPDAYHWKSIVYLSWGKFDESLAFEKKAVALDPTSIRFNENLIRIFYYSGNYQKAIIQADEMIEFDNQLPASYLFQALCYTELRFFDLALQLIEKTIKLRNHPEILLKKALIYEVFGHKKKAKEILNEVLLSYPKVEIDDFDIAKVYAVMGDNDNAFNHLEKAMEKKSSLLYFKVDIKFKNLWGDKRFDEILIKLNRK